MAAGDRLGDLDAVDRRRQDAAGIARALAGREQARAVFRLWKSRSRVMRTGEEVRVSTPVRTASSRSKPGIWRPNTGRASRIAAMA